MPVVGQSKKEPMSIKTRLKISASVLIVLAMTMITTLVLMAREIEQATEGGLIADRIVKGAGDLNVLARAFVSRQQEESTEAQWWDRRNSLALLISKASLRGEKEKLLLDRLTNTNAGLKPIFNLILIYRSLDSHASAQRKELYAESEERLAAQLLAKTQGMVYDGGLLVQASNDAILAVQHRAFQIVFSLMVMLIGTVLLTFYHLYSIIVRSFETLQDGARVIAKGNFDHRVVLAGPSEIAGLATTFNAMGGQLKVSYQSLETSKRKYQDLTEFLPQTIFETDRSGRLTFVNREAVRAFGFTGEEVPGRVDFLQLISEDDKIATRDAMERSMNDRCTARVDSMARRKDGNRFPVSVYFSPVLDNADVVGVRGILIDMTEQKRVEQQLQQAHKMEAIGTLSGGIAHDFNNILAAIMGFTELALGDLADRPEKRFLEHILKAAVRGRDLVRQILTFSRRGEYSHKPVAIGPIMEETIKLLRASIPSIIEIRHNVSPETLIVRSDPTQIQQVLMNLVMNAAYAMREIGGLLQIDVSRAYPGRHEDQTRPDMGQGAYVKISVTDNGTGMNDATMKRIFDPFFTTKGTGEGTGLGLSVVHGIVEDHGGTIEVESKLGKGSVFHILLPLVDELPSTSKEPGDELTSREHGRILLVDDEPDIVEAEKAMLERLGYAVVASVSSVDALKVFDKEPQRFDIIITDQTMPDMTGMALAKKIIEKRADVPVILCTGYSEVLSEEEIQKAGIRELVMKPVSKREIRDILRRALTRREKKGPPA
jgi:PAS domain S-box-containing protein